MVLPSNRQKKGVNSLNRNQKKRKVPTGAQNNTKNKSTVPVNKGKKKRTPSSFRSDSLSVSSSSSSSKIDPVTAYLSLKTPPKMTDKPTSYVIKRMRQDGITRTNKPSTSSDDSDNKDFFGCFNFSSEEESVERLRGGGPSSIITRQSEKNLSSIPLYITTYKTGMIDDDCDKYVTDEPLRLVGGGYDEDESNVSQENYYEDLPGYWAGQPLEKTKETLSEKDRRMLEENQKFSNFIVAVKHHTKVNSVDRHDPRSDKFAGYSVKERAAIESSLPNHCSLDKTSFDPDLVIGFEKKLVNATHGTIKRFLDETSHSPPKPWFFDRPLLDFVLSQSDKVELLHLAGDDTIFVMFGFNINVRDENNDLAEKCQNAFAFLKMNFLHPATQDSLDPEKNLSANSHMMAVVQRGNIDNRSTYTLLSLILFQTPKSVSENEIKPMDENAYFLNVDRTNPEPLQPPTVIKWVCTRDVFRSSGMGNKLLQIVASMHVCLYECVSLYLIVDVVEQSTARFYQNKGFKQLKKIDDDNPWGAAFSNNDVKNQLNEYATGMEYSFGAHIPMHLYKFPTFQRCDILTSLVAANKNIVRQSSDDDLIPSTHFELIAKALTLFFSEDIVQTMPMFFEDTITSSPTNWNNPASASSRRKWNGLAANPERVIEKISIEARIPLSMIVCTTVDSLLDSFIDKKFSTRRQQDLAIAFNQLELETIHDISYCFFTVDPKSKDSVKANLYCEQCQKFLITADQSDDPIKTIPFHIVRALVPILASMHNCTYYGEYSPKYNEILQTLPNKVCNDDRAESTARRRLTRKGTNASDDGFPSESDTKEKLKDNESLGNCLFVHNNHVKGSQILLKRMAKEHHFSYDISPCSKITTDNMSDKSNCLLDAALSDSGLRSDICVASQKWTKVLSFLLFCVNKKKFCHLYSFVFPNKNDRRRVLDSIPMLSETVNAYIDKLNVSVLDRINFGYTSMAFNIRQQFHLPEVTILLDNMPYLKDLTNCSNAQYPFFSLNLHDVRDELAKKFPKSTIDGVTLFAYYHYTRIQNVAYYPTHCDRFGTPKITEEIARNWLELPGPYNLQNNSKAWDKRKNIHSVFSTSSFLVPLVREEETEYEQFIGQYGTQLRWQMFADRKEDIPDYIQCTFYTMNEFRKLLNKTYKQKYRSDCWFKCRPSVWAINNEPPTDCFSSIGLMEGWDNANSVRELLGVWYLNCLDDTDILDHAPTEDQTRVKSIINRTMKHIKGIKKLESAWNGRKQPEENETNQLDFSLLRHHAYMETGKTTKGTRAEKENSKHILNSAAFLIKCIVERDEFILIKNTLQLAESEAQEIFDKQGNPTYELVFVAEPHVLKMFSLDFLGKIMDKGLQTWTNITNKSKKYFHSLNEHLPYIRTVELCRLFPSTVVKVEWVQKIPKGREQKVFRYQSDFDAESIFDNGDIFAISGLHCLTLLGKGLKHIVGTGALYGCTDHVVRKPPCSEPSLFEQTIIIGNRCALSASVNIAKAHQLLELAEQLSSLSSSVSESPTMQVCLQKMKPFFTYQKIPEDRKVVSDTVFNYLQKMHERTGMPIIAELEGSVYNVKTHCVGIHMSQIFDGSTSSSYPFTSENLNFSMGVNISVARMVKAYFLIPNSKHVPCVRDCNSWTYNIQKMSLPEFRETNYNNPNHNKRSRKARNERNRKNKMKRRKIAKSTQNSKGNK